MALGLRSENHGECTDGGRHRASGAGGVGREAQEAHEPDEYREFDHVWFCAPLQLFLTHPTS